MDNQHRKISGYRELSQAEIDLMNRIKAFGPELQKLLDDVWEHINAEYDACDDAPIGHAEINRLDESQPHRWVEIAKTDLQTGLMALTRAVAQPGAF